MNNQNELQRCQRTLTGLELTKAKATSHRLDMAVMGISTSNLVFDSDLASQYLDPEVLEILKDDPEKDDGIMYTRVPTDAQTSTIHKSDKGGSKSLDLDSDDDEQIQFMNHNDLDQLDRVFTGTENVINQLPYFIHDLKRWRNGFDSLKFYRNEKLLEKQRLSACVDADNLTVNGTIRKRKAETKPRRKRVPRKTRTHTNVLMS